MKKTVLFSVAAIMAITSANAGFFSNLFGQKSAEPQTLAQACNKDEITQFCPEIILGQMTIQECLMANVSKLSTKCANFVKKAATEKIESVTGQIATVQNGVMDATDEQKQQVAAQQAAAQQAKDDLKSSWQETKAAAKAFVAAEKAIFKGNAE